MKSVVLAHKYEVATWLTETHSHDTLHSTVYMFRAIYRFAQFRIALHISEIAKMHDNFEIACAILRLRRALAQSRDRALAASNLGPALTQQ